MQICKYTDEFRDNQECFMVRVSREEAIKIIRSLSTQIDDSDPNTNRSEFTTDDGQYLSIGVICRDQTTKQFFEARRNKSLHKKRKFSNDLVVKHGPTWGKL